MIAPTLALARRALRNTARRPQFLAPILVFPSLFLAINVGGLSQARTLPGFPDTQFLDFQLAAAMTQSLLLGGVSTGIAVALELELGFFDRLVTAPVPRAALVLGRLCAAFVTSLLAVAFFLVVGLVFGAELAGGVLAVPVVLLIGGVAGVGFAAIGTTLALRAGSASTVQGIFPLVFVILFVSSAFFPQDLLEEPARSVAAYNPLSFVAEGLRAPIIEGIAAGPVLGGLAAAAAIAAGGIALSIAALQGRLRDA